MSLYAKSEKDDINSLMPLLFAAHPEFKPSFKKMADMDAKHKRTYFALEHRFRPWRNDAKKFGSEQDDASTNASPTANRKHRKDDSAAIGQSPAKKRITKKGTATPVKKLKKATSDGEDEDEAEKSDSGEILQKAVQKAVSSKKNVAVTVKDGVAGVEGTAVVIKAEDPGVSDAELLGEAF